MRLCSVLMIPYDWQSIFSEFPLLVEKPAPPPPPWFPPETMWFPKKSSDSQVINNDCPIKMKIFFLHAFIIFVLVLLLCDASCEALTRCCYVTPPWISFCATGEVCKSPLKPKIQSQHYHPEQKTSTSRRNYN